GSACRALPGVLDLDEVADLPQHTGELWALRVLRDPPDLAQTERAQDAAVALRLADRAPGLRDPDLRHQLGSSVFSPALRRRPRFGSAAGASSTGAWSTAGGAGSPAGAAAAGPRDAPRALRSRAQEDPRSVEAAENLVRDRGAVLRHGEEVLLGVVDSLRDRQRHLAGLAVADPDPIDLVADHDERGEREA